MKFFRVENDKNEGPYNNQIVSIMDYLEKKGYDIWMSKHDDYMQGHPRPDSDYLLAKIWATMPGRADYIFGFETLDAVFNWFSMPDEISFMKDFNFHVSIYETDDCYHGKWQSIANKNSLKLIDILSF